MLNQHQTIKDNIELYNRANPLVDYLVPFVKGKGNLNVLDVGSGPYSTIGSHHPAIRKIYHCDKQRFFDFYNKYDMHPFVTIEYEDMESLTYQTDFFDLVHCANALDHTRNAGAAIREMIRVCKPGGYVYIVCNLNQKDTGHKHFWNFKADGKFTNGNEEYDLKDFGFAIESIDKGGESRYNQVVAVLKK